MAQSVVIMKAVVIVDGLNLHHALSKLGPNHTRPDIPTISSRLLNVNSNLLKIHYFSAAPQHLGRTAMDEYLNYKELLRQNGVNFIESRFQVIQRTCTNCGTQSIVHKEKESDVAIALQILEAASDGMVEKVLVFSADSDLAPAFRLARTLRPEIQLFVAQTSSYLRHSPNSLGKLADATIRLRSQFIHNYQFPS